MKRILVSSLQPGDILFATRGRVVAVSVNAGPQKPVLNGSRVRSVEYDLWRPGLQRRVEVENMNGVKVHWWWPNTFVTVERERAEKSFAEPKIMLDKVSAGHYIL